MQSDLVFAILQGIGRPKWSINIIYFYIRFISVLFELTVTKKNIIGDSVKHYCRPRLLPREIRASCSVGTLRFIAYKYSYVYLHIYKFRRAV